MNASDDPLKYYNAAWELFGYGVLKTEDLPKLFEPVCASETGEMEIIEGGLPDIDFFDSVEEPSYVENFIKAVIDRLRNELEIPMAGGVTASDTNAVAGRD